VRTVYSDSSSSSSAAFWQVSFNGKESMGAGNAYLVSGLLLFVPLLVGGSLGLVRGTLLLGQSLPLLAELLADLTWVGLDAATLEHQDRRLTELDTGVVLADLLALLVGEEHVGRETTLGRVGIYSEVSFKFRGSRMHVSDLPFFFLPPSALVALPLPRVTFSLGMM
jgi:hypothetical protein